MDRNCTFLNTPVGMDICWTFTCWPSIIEGERQRDFLRIFLHGAAVSGGMERFWNTGPDWLVLCIWIAVLAVSVTVAYYVVEKIRPKPVQKERNVDQWLSKFSELHSQGELSDEEFRTIKTTLAAQPRDELKDNGDNG